MHAEELLREGKAQEALDSLKDLIRKDPSNPKFRIFLFQLLAVLGDWDKSLTQLNVSGELDPSALPMVQTYREALNCEVLRDQVFAGKKSPLFLGEPENWLALLVESLRLGTEGHHEQAQELRGQAFEEAPGTAGWINGEAFEWIADADPRLGPVLEVIVHGRYYWLPFHQISELEIEEPTDLRDMVWNPGHIKLTNEGTAVGLIPTRYPDSQSSEDPLIQLARKTDWAEVSEDFYTGLGQRLFATDAGEYPMLETRTIVMKSEDGAPSDVIPESDVSPEKEDDAG